MVVWAITIPLLVVLASIVFRPAVDRGGALARVGYQWRWSIVTLWFTAVILLIMVRFWDYWSTLW
ncbi:vitamin K epoxide reductase [Mycobacterium tuberculosis]|nr:vitamin K epoxide reductase [Mycobacterium tuberculosis]